jgi:hypothetical protein
MNNDYPVVYTITQDVGGYRIYTKDSRVSSADMCITEIKEDKLFSTMVMISTIINNEGRNLGVAFEVD